MPAATSYDVGLRAIPLRSLANLLVGVPLAAFGCALLGFYYASTPFRLLSVALQLVMAGYMLIVSDNQPLKRISVGVLLLCLPIAIANAPETEAKSLIVPLCFLGGVGCAWYALEFGRTRAVLEVPFYAYLALTIYLIGVKEYGPEQFNEFYVGASRNGYSAILFATACGYVISRAVRGRRPSLLLLAAAFVCSIPLYGRASIVALAIVFAAVAAKRWSSVFVLVVTTAAAVIALWYVEIASVANLTNFKGGLESDRWQIISDYLFSLNPRSLLIGVRFGDVNSILENGGSPDVAFLRLHSFLGIAAFAFLGLFLISAVTLVRNRFFLLFCVLLAILFRAVTDVILLFGTVDYFLTPVLFSPYFLRYLAAARLPVRRGFEPPAAVEWR
jgi:hypothetical protein